MGTFIHNPRRAPRAPVRCQARLALTEGGYWASPTSDYGPSGCQLLAPLPLKPGSRVFIELMNEKIERPVQLTGQVAWCAKAEPWRMGVCFDPGSHLAAKGFFEALAAAYPGIDTYGRAPDRIPVDAPLAPARPPEVEPLLTDDEARLLADLGAGRRASEVTASGDGAVNAIFALLGRRYVVVGEPDGPAAEGWAAVLLHRRSR